MSSLNELYQEVILDHNRRPRNYGALEPSDRTAVGNNPLCGDRFTVYLQLDGERIKDAKFEGQGCAISKSSASMMTDAVKGKTVAEAGILFEKFREMVTRKPGAHFDQKTLGKLSAFAGICEFPMRVKCAVLGWHTLRAALEGKIQATTE